MWMPIGMNSVGCIFHRIILANIDIFLLSHFLFFTSYTIPSINMFQRELYTSCPQWEYGWEKSVKMSNSDKIKINIFKCLVIIRFWCQVSLMSLNYTFLSEKGILAISRVDFESKHQKVMIETNVNFVYHRKARVYRIFFLINGKDVQYIELKHCSRHDEFDVPLL